MIKRAGIAATRFTTPHGLATTVESYNPITGKLTWKNNEIPSGTEILAGYALGHHDPATDEFHFLLIEHEGVAYIAGSVVGVSAPSPGTTRDEDVPSYAPPVQEETVCDALAFIAQGSLGVLTADLKSGTRIVGLRLADFQGLAFAGAGVFANVLTMNPPPSNLMLQRFFVLTIPVTGTGYWQMHCDIYNPDDHPVSGSIHVTGRLWTQQANFPVDEVFEFTIPARGTHRCSLNWNKYNYLPEGASCWFEVDTSWGDKVPRTHWTAGFYTGDNGLNALSITSSSAVLRYTSRNGGRKFSYTVWSPPTWPDHTIYEDCIREDEYMSIYTACYWHVLTLLSGRQYKAQCSVDAMGYAETLFTTPT